MIRPHFLLLLAVLTFSSLPSFAQLGPLNWTAPVKIQSNNIFLLWHDNAAVGDSIHQKIYAYNYHNDTIPPETRINGTLAQGSETGSSDYTDAANGHFTHGARDNVVSIWGPDANGIHIMLPKFDTTAMGWSSSTSAVITGDIQNRRIYARTLDIDGDSLDEFVVSYMDNNDSIHLNLYDVDSLLQPTLIASYCDQMTVSPGNPGGNWVMYALETGDFNGDGTDEVALLVNHGFPGSVMHIGVQIYAVAEGALVPMATGDVQYSGAGLSNAPDRWEMCAVAGNYLGDGKEELAIGNAFYNAGYGNEFQVRCVTISTDLLTMTVGNISTTTLTLGGQGDIPLAADRGKLFDDAHDEIVAGVGVYTYLIKMDTGDSSFAFIDDKQIGLDIDLGPVQVLRNMYDFVKITDVDQDGIPDVIASYGQISVSSYGGLTTMIINVDTATETFTDSSVPGAEVYAPNTIGAIYSDEQQPFLDPNQGIDYGFRPYAIAVGSYDGLDYTIGEPTHHVGQIAQPVVVLNAPPVHFDVLNGDTYDLNTCYNGGDCPFSSTYYHSLTTIAEVSSVIQSDWVTSDGLSVSGSVSFGAETAAAPLGCGLNFSASISIDYEFHMLDTYGEHFSNTSTSSFTRSIESAITATEDDRIYSTITEYDVWEYPLYHGDETFPRATILTFVPLDVISTWYSSKSFDAPNYAPEHEVGNVLSYPKYADLDQNPNVGQLIAGSAGISYEVDASSFYPGWNLSWADFQSSSDESSHESGTDIGATATGFQTEGNFNSKQLHSQTNSVTEQVSLSAIWGHVDPSINANYWLTPYAYWGAHGALVLDYAADPEIASPGNVPTWWQTWYDSLPDPTFILPWLLDPEKGLALTDPAKREQTMDIHFFPGYTLPGDTLSITVRVRNFSLVPMSAPVSVSYYLGDPDAAGVPIIGVSGTNTIYTDGPIPERGYQDVTLRWVVPAGMQPYPRVYAVLDEGNEIAEIHEGNNVGFRVLGALLQADGVAELPAMSGGFGLGECYPNPFSSITSIDYSLTSDDRTTIQVFDQMGQLVATVLDKTEHPGDYTTSFDGSQLPAGMYILTIRSGALYDSRRMVIVR